MIRFYWTSFLFMTGLFPFFALVFWLFEPAVSFSIYFNVVIFVIYYFLMFKTIHYHRSEVVSKAIFTIFICLIIAGVSSSFMFSFSHNDRFTKQNWINQPDERVYMIDDMIDDFSLKGKTFSEIKTHLGDPDQDDAYLFIYVLGSKGFFMSYLHIWFDEDGLVENYYVYSD